MKRQSYQQYLTPMTYSRRIVMFFIVFLLALAATGLIIGAIPSWKSPSARHDFIEISVLQDIVLFILPAFLSAFMMSRRPFGFLGIPVKVKGMAVLGIVLIFILGIPAINQLVYWNEHISLPASLADLEHTLRSMEDAAGIATGIMMSSVSLEGLCVEIAVIGLLAPLSEELFFRGAMQRIFASGKGMSPHLAIWLSAVLFSLFHFQFFGFFPRMILGAFFGYLFYWTGSIWVSVLAHALNNTLVVVTMYIARVYPDKALPDDLGVTVGSFPWFAVISAILVGLVFVFYRRPLFLFSASKK